MISITQAAEATTREALFVSRVFETIARFDMVQKSDAILAAVSGGPDSVAMVRVLLFLANSRNLTIGIAHLNHDLRGEESQRDEAFVREWAQKLGVPFYCKTVDVLALAKKEHLSIEEAGRNARYDFFVQTADTHGYTKIATGHTLDDNAEQVLMNLLRGSGPKGLCGIPPVRGNRFIRPLIKLSKAQILTFLKDKNQAFVTDSSNTDESYLRNKIRHNLIPRLEQQFNPEIKISLDRLSHILRQEEDFLTDQAARALNRCTARQTKTFVALSIPELVPHHPALVNRVLRLSIGLVKQDLRRITLTHIQDILTLMDRSESGKSLDLPGQIRVYRTGETLCIQKESLPLRELGKAQKQLRRGTSKNPKGEI